VIDEGFLFIVLRQVRDDWVSFVEMRALYIEAVGVSKATEDVFWQSLEQILADKILVVGELNEKEAFIRWELPISECVSKMKIAAAAKNELFPGDVCWFDLPENK